MRVIQVVDSLNVGGAEMTAVNIANGLYEREIESYLCVTRKKGDLEKNLKEKVGLLFLNKKRVIDVKALRLFLSYVHKNSINIVHAHSSSIFFVIQAKLFNWKLKIVWHDHYGISANYSQRPILALKICSFFMSCILSVNNDLKEWAIKKLVCKNVVFLPNFSELSNFTNERTQLKGEQGKRIVMIAGLRPQKDHINLLKAFLKIVTIHSDWSLHIIGRNYQDEYAHSIESFIEQNNLKENVFLYGLKSDIKNLLSQSEIAILSSKSEGLPLSLIEYGLSKTPTVTTNVGQCSEVIGNSEFVVTKENSSQLAKAILKLIENKTLRETEGNRFYKRVQDNYSKKSYLNKLLKLYA